MLIGYARVSTSDQTVDLQKDALENEGCTGIFKNTASGAKAEQTGLDEALNYVRTGDTLVVWHLDVTMLVIERQLSNRVVWRQNPFKLVGLGWR